MRNKVVLHFRDGGIVKGHAVDFRPADGWIHVVERRTGMLDAVRLRDLKAVYFVRDFDGDPTRKDDGHVLEAPTCGRQAIVDFHDGERLYGFTQGFERNCPGFFVFPSDPAGNNERVFVVHDATRSVELIRRSA